MPVFTDQLNRDVDVPFPPRRIVSLVPSQTELLHSLSLEEEVVGITKFCVHPQEWFRTKERVGGTKNINIEKVRSLSPDLIIANKEENTQTQIEQLAQDFPVWVSDVNHLSDALQMIQQLGEITNRAKESKALAAAIQSQFERLLTPAETPRVAYLIWKDPWMTVGGDTFIHHLLQRCGFVNVFAGQLRYPSLSIEELQAAECRFLLLSSEPYPFRQKHIDELQAMLPQTTIMLVDGELFSWYGSRLLKAPAYFQKLQSQMGVLL